MERKFIKTHEIEQIEKAIDNLKDSLAERKEKLKELFQTEFDKQFGLIIGKTIIKTSKGNEYVYMGLDYRYSYNEWILGSKINKDGNISKATHSLYNEWEKTDKEYKQL